MKIVYSLLSGLIILIFTISFVMAKNNIIYRLNRAAFADTTNSTKIKKNKGIGIGPIKKLKLGPVDQKLADDGKTIFNDKCTACHNLDVEIQAPPLRQVTKELRPEYILNYLLNTVEMQEKEPQVKDLIKKYNGEAMPDLELKEPQARALLEYFRSVAK